MEKSDKIKNQKINYKRLLKFFIPLAVTPFFITSIHTLMNAAIARLPYPELSIAVFTIVKGISNAIKAPTRMFMQISVSMVDDRRSYLTASKLVWLLSGLFFILLAILGYTPLGGWFLRNIMGLNDLDTIKFTLLGLRITAFLPIVETLRNFHRGLVISHERTRIVTAGTAVRLFVISIFLFLAVKFQLFSGVITASLAWTAGIGIEALVVVFGVIYYYKSPLRAAELLPTKNKTVLRVSHILSFFIPLAAMRYLRSFIQPLIQSGIARSQADPTLALAAFGVAYGLMMIIVETMRNLHQCSLIYVSPELNTETEKENWLTVKRFCLATGIILTIISFIIALSPIGYFILRYAIGVSAEVADLGRYVLIALSFLPFIRAVREVYWGRLMNRKTTRLIGYGKAVNLGAVFISLFIFIVPLNFAVFISPAIIAAISFSIGQAAETLLIFKYARPA
ncbi:MAG: hypothetical protein ACOCZZ_01960 [Bacillota bacterium]